VWVELAFDECPGHLDDAPLLVSHREVEHGFLPGMTLSSGGWG
jgi:hypothetical protein